MNGFTGPLVSDRDLAACALEPIHVPCAIQPHGAVIAVRADSLRISHASANLDRILGQQARSALGRELPDIIGAAASQALIGTGPGGMSCSIPGVDGQSLDLHAHHCGPFRCIDLEPLPPVEAVHARVTMAQSVIDTFELAATRVELCDLAVRGLRAITQYDRVMAYRFNEDGDGEVIAEAHAPDLRPYFGQRYPASDIPAQARALYLKQRVGAIADAAYVPVPLLSDPALDGGVPLDLTQCSLRSVSPLHRQYMRNMGTAASLTLGIANGPSLWGMLVCHHRTPRVATPHTRAIAAMIGRVASLLVGSIGAAETYAGQLERQAILHGLLERIASPAPLRDALVKGAQDLLALVRASGALLRLGGEITVIGRTPAPDDGSRALQRLYAEARGEVLAVQDIGARFPGLDGCTRDGSGALLLPLGSGTDDAILWFRPELPETIIWGGDPCNHANRDPATGVLSPRASFEAWQEITKGKSAPWTAADLALAQAVRPAIEREAARRVRSELDRFNRVFEASPIALVLTGHASRIEMANQQTETLFRYSKQELHGKPLALLLQDRCWDRQTCVKQYALTDMAAREAGQELVLCGRRKDGSQFFLELDLSHVELNGQTMMVVSMTDITKRREAERRQRKQQRALEHANADLKQATKAKLRFLAGMSHELRTPLAGIIGYAQLLRIEGKLAPAQIDAMLSAGQHLLGMINGVLDLAEIESKPLAMQTEDVDLRALAATCLDLVRPMADTKTLSLHLDTDGRVPGLTRTDPLRVRQILLNLLGNAVKFTLKGGITLGISMSTDAAMLVFDVADTGPGISAEQRPRLFKAFERLGDDSSRSIEGAGFGLSISAQIAAMMGGKLKFTERPGGGSVFTLTLPAAQASPPQAAAADIPPRSTAKGEAPHLRVLVVDDILMNRDIAASFLRSAGHEVHCAESGIGAIAAVQGGDFDVVLMDVRMPGMDGMEAARRIRQIGGARGRVPIVALTAEVFTEQVEDCRKAGMTDHCAKPFSAETLLGAVYRAAAAAPPRERSAERGTQAEPKLAEAEAEAAQDGAAVLFDPAIFEHVSAAIGDKSVASYLRKLSDNGDALLCRLRVPAALHSQDLSAAVHALAGSAGMFGFVRLTETALQFEQAVSRGEPDAACLAQSLAAAVEASIDEMQRRALIH